MKRVIVIDAITEEVISKATSEVKNTQDVIYLCPPLKTVLKITGNPGGFISEFIEERQMRKEVDFLTTKIEKW